MTISLHKPSGHQPLAKVAIEAVGAGARGSPTLLVLCLDRDGRLVSPDALVWFRHPSAGEGALRFVDEARVANGAGTGEIVEIDLDRLSSATAEVALCLATDEIRADQPVQIEVYVVERSDGSQIARSLIELTSVSRSMKFGRLMRAQHGWHFVAADRGYDVGLADIVRRFVNPLLETATSRTATQAPATAKSPEDRFLEILSTDLGSGYCEASTHKGLIARGIQCGLDAMRAEVMLDGELERAGVANEAALLRRLDALLRRFTDDDRKLDDKERKDAFQIVCRPANGFSRGLRDDVADQYVLKFCRERGVKVKVGLLRWAVP